MKLYYAPPPETHRDAEMAVERLVQEFGVERTDIFVATAGDENSAGEERAGSDTEASAPSPEDGDDAALNGSIQASVDSEDDGDGLAHRVCGALPEFSATSVEEDERLAPELRLQGRAARSVICAPDGEACQAQGVPHADRLP